MWLDIMFTLLATLASGKTQTTTINVKDLAYLVYRPTEPIFLPKGEEMVVFEAPQDYMRQRYQILDASYFNSFYQNPSVMRRIPVRRQQEPDRPDIADLARLPRRSAFSQFIPEHRRLATKLIHMFIAEPSLENLISTAVYVRSHVNPYMFVYAFKIAMMHRNDTRSVNFPPVTEIFPDKFVDGAVFPKAREEANTVLDPGKRIPIAIPMDFTASDLEEEHRVAYFREDVGVNLHHWYWHLSYPHDGPLEVVKKDRRGELFYYLHHQILARYNFERFSVRLQRVKRFINFREPIAEGYFPKLTSLNAARVWPARSANTIISDVDRQVDNVQFDIQDLERWRDRIFDAIHFGAVLTEDGNRQNLTMFGGIDILGNMVEASMLSPNKPLYGDLHNMAHVAFSFAHDPDNRHLESFGVMGDTATAMRDPIFYRWHAMTDDIFMEHKNLLPPYTAQELNFKEVRLTKVEVLTKGNRKKNEFNTFWQQNDFDMSRGLDFAPGGPLLVRVTHLQHRPFVYTIQIENESPDEREGFVRIFLAPKLDERGVPMPFGDQRHFMVEMDRFRVTLRSTSNTVLRESSESSVTTRHLRLNMEKDRSEGADEYFCGCGWPQHMLVPRGTAEGMPAQLFVMVTDYAQDSVDQDPGVPTGPGSCSEAPVMCGQRGGLYPDRRPMGFPFDRRPRAGADSLRSFTTPNMMALDVLVRFSPRVEAPSARNASQRSF